MFAMGFDTNFIVRYEDYNVRIDRATSGVAALKITKKSAGRYIQEVADRTRLAVRLAKDYAPVNPKRKTGKHMYQTIWGRPYISKDGLRVRCLIKVGAPYAPYVEFGTSRSRANPFFRRAMVDAFGDIMPARKIRSAVGISKEELPTG